MIADGYGIFAQAQQHWRAQVYPRHLSYGITVTVERNGKTSQAHYHAAYDADLNRVSVNASSDEELAHPYTPHGINFGLNLFGGHVPMSSPQFTFDYLGVPVLTPDYAFGIVPSDAPPNTTRSDMDLVREIRREFHDPMPARKQMPGNESLRTIATVVVTHRDYDVRVLGTQPLDGHTDYHLALKPLLDPAMYRLREMWVDTSTFATDRVITAGDFTADGLSKIRWQTDYRQIDGATFIDSENALAGISLDRRRYDAASVAFTGITPTQSAVPYASLNGFRLNSETAPPGLTEPAKPRV
ncbi:MAG TPA: hypothetical protein VIO32_10895 [Candidatus Baltobacteraceae bacterium]